MQPTDVLYISEPIEKMFMDCQSQLIINLCEHLKGDTSDLAKWELQKLSELDAVTAESRKIIAQNTGKSADEITKAITEGLKLETVPADRVLSAAANKGLIDAPSHSWNTSFGTQQIIKNLSAQATDSANLVNTIMLQSTRAQYANAINTFDAYTKLNIEKMLGANNTLEFLPQLDTAQSLLNKGAMSTALGIEARQTAMRRTITELADKGITGFMDKAGRKWSPEAYVNMVIRTTVHNAAIEGQRSRSADYGVYTFQISSHAGARPLCAPYQGKFYSWDNTSGVVEDLYGGKHSYKPINSTSYGEPAGIFGINCGHFPLTFVDGFSVARYKPDDSTENAKQYQLSQSQRYMERNIRNSETKFLCFKAVDDVEAQKQIAAKIFQQKAQYKQFCKANGLTPRLDRTTVTAFADVEKAAKELVKQKQVIASSAEQGVIQKAAVVDGKNVLHKVLTSGKISIQDAIHTQGYDGLPTILKEQQFNKAVTRANNGDGFIAQRTYTAATKEVLDDYRDMLYHGDFYVDCSVGGAQYGQGMYCAADYSGVLSSGIREEMAHYQSLGRRRFGQDALSHTETLTLDTSAKVVPYDTLQTEFFAYRKNFKNEFFKEQLDTLGNYSEDFRTIVKGEFGFVHDFNKILEAVGRIQGTPEFDELPKVVSDIRDMADKLEMNVSDMNIGTYAVLRGYDVINAVGHGASGSYTVVLNRTKLVIKGE